MDIVGNDSVGRPIIIQRVSADELAAVADRLARRVDDGTVRWFAVYGAGEPTGIYLADEMWRQHANVDRSVTEYEVRRVHDDALAGPEGYASIIEAQQAISDVYGDDGTLLRVVKRNA